MTNEQLVAVVDAIKKGVLAKDSPLSILEFEAIHAATLQTVAIGKRELAQELVAGAKAEFKQQVEALAMRIP